MLKNLIKQRRLLPLCYGMAVFLWLLFASINFIGDTARSQSQLNIQGAQALALAPAGQGQYTSQGVDPQLVFENINLPLRTLRLKAQFLYGPGEMELFYTYRQGQGFSPRRRAIGVPQSDGSYLYSIPAGNVSALRIDLGSLGGNSILVQEIQLNPKLPASQYFLPSLGALAVLVAAPALACCAFYIIIDVTKVIAGRKGATDE